MNGPQRRALGGVMVFGRRSIFHELSCGVFAMLMLLPSAVARGQVDPIQVDIDTTGLVIEATLGWDGTVDRQHGVPVSMLINNFSERDIEGELTLSDPRDGRVARLGELFVGAGATRRFGAIQAMQDWEECLATLRKDGRVLWRRKLDLDTGNQFASNMNFALCIDDDGNRRLQLSLPALMATSLPQQEDLVAPEQGRPVTCLAVKSWQVPDHPGPLTVARTIVFPEQTDIDSLNRAQWGAVSEWVCQGGALFVHVESREIIQRLRDLMPLPCAAPETDRVFQVHQAGLGGLYEYGTPLFSSAGTETRRAIAELTSKRGGEHVSCQVDISDVHRRKVGSSDRNSVLLVGFFGVYTFLSGILALLLFRLNQRQMGIYTVVVVVSATVIATLLGGVLQISAGDVRWITATRLTTGGIVQTGTVDLRSAGGRKSLFTVQGNRPDMQGLSRVRRYYYGWQTNEFGYPAFTQLPNLSQDEGEFQLRVPMTPWGTRHLQLTDYQSNVRGVGFTLTFAPDTSENSVSSSTSGGNNADLMTPRGEFTLRLTNDTPFELEDAWIVIGVTHQVPGDSNQMGSVSRDPWGNSNAWVPGALVDVYHKEQLATLKRDTTREFRFAAKFAWLNNRWERSIGWDNGSVVAPKISRLGTANAWLIARLAKSPILSIDQQQSDFTVVDGLHIYIQEIDPEFMPDANEFLQIAGEDVKSP